MSDPKDRLERAQGLSVVEGIAIGRAIVSASDPTPRRAVGTIHEEHARLARAIGRATSGVEELLRLLPRTEAELFEPELVILGELGPILFARVGSGMPVEDAVNEIITSEITPDLMVDARTRLLDGLALGANSIESLLEGRTGDRVLVTDKLTPSVVASLPARVVGIVAASEDGRQGAAAQTSHAAILARGRDIPFAFVAPRIAQAVVDDDYIVLDTTVNPASIWLKPTEVFLAKARVRREETMLMRAQDEARVTAPLSHLGIEVHANVGSLHERVPASAEGIGLIRTELLFLHRLSAPSEGEQLSILRAIAARVKTAPVVVRLFDAGGDKPLIWLQAPEGSAAPRGIELLLMHPAILDAQLRAMVRAADHGDIRALLPFVTRASDVEQVRARSSGKLKVGAMIETPNAVAKIDEIVEVADFICIGTNDLFATVTGKDRADATLSLDARALRMIERVVLSAHAHGRKVTVCGEIAGDPHSARILVGLGVDALSVATVRLARIKLALRDITNDDCRRVAQEAMK
ncbi:MAG: aldolase/citrate lyase family protein [Myxococcota bacterium]|nr:aldolase/citrate lyase family protein [Myxococcota bacterium]